MEETPSRTLRSATSPTSAQQVTIRSRTPGSELTEKTKESALAGKRKTLEDTSDDDDEDEEDESSAGKRQRLEKTDIDQTDIEFNRAEKKYVIMKVRSGDSITSPCWSSKLCQVATLSKEGLALMKKPKSKSMSIVQKFLY